MAYYREHYKRQFTNDHQDFSDVACPLPRPEPRHITFPKTEVIFAPAAIRKRIKFLAKCKAAGTIGIMGEVLQAAGEVIVEVVQCLFLAYSQWATFREDPTGTEERGPYKDQKLQTHFPD